MRETWTVRRLEPVTRPIRSVAWLLAIPGLLLIALGVLVVLQPQILVVLAAALFIGAGLSLVGAAFGLWRFQRAWRRWRQRQARYWRQSQAWDDST